MSSQPETYEFQAEINDLMSLIINTFYSNKDIFLRELISNASDAIDKARHQLLVGGQDLREFEIKITGNKENNTLTIEDNGIGMSKEDLVANLGTIASSGTKQFMQKMLAEKSDGDSLKMIGQFGVGFYSAFLVASSVKVYSGKHSWESTASGTFTIAELEDDACVQHGCKMVLALKDDCAEYTDTTKISEIVKMHSQFINYPIQLWTTRIETKEVDNDDEEAGDEANTEEEGKIEEVSDEEPSKKKKTVEETIEEWKCLNLTKPIWIRNPSDVTQEEYESFYKALTNSWEGPMKTKHFNAEGQIEYKAVLFVPKQAPFDMFNSNKRKSNVKLYVKRVLLMDNCEDLIPEWLRFVSGVIDSDDLPLNVSREMLQQNSIIKIIKKNVVKKCIEMFTDLLEDEEDYKKFYEQFSTSIKMGIHEDSANRDKLVKLLRFDSAMQGKSISLQEYVDGMSEDQENIYYITGESKMSVMNSPFTQGLVNEKKVDVLLMTEAIDEYMCQSIREFDNKKLVNITKDNSQFYTSDASLDEHLCKRMKDVLGVSKVVVSTRLHKDPCCIMSSEYGWSANMQRIVKAQAMQNNTNSFMMGNKSQNTLEINPNHTMIKQLQEGIVKSTMKDTTIDDIINLIYETSMISCGYSHDDPSSYSDRVYRIIALGLGDPTETETEIEVNTGKKNADVNVELEMKEDGEMNLKCVPCSDENNMEALD